MASVSIVPTSGLREPSGNTVGADRLPDEINDIKIRDDKVCYQFLQFVWFNNWLLIFHISFTYAITTLQEMEATVVDGNGTETGHIIVTTIGVKNGQPKQVIVYNFLLWSKSLQGLIFGCSMVL